MGAPPRVRFVTRAFINGIPFAADQVVDVEELGPPVRVGADNEVVDTGGREVSRAEYLISINVCEPAGPRPAPPTPPSPRPATAPRRRRAPRRTT